jgi:hypothetical protein
VTSHVLQRLPLDGSAATKLDWRHETVKYLSTYRLRRGHSSRHAGISHSQAAHRSRSHSSGAGLAHDTVFCVGH